MANNSNHSGGTSQKKKTPRALVITTVLSLIAIIASLAFTLISMHIKRNKPESIFSIDSATEVTFTEPEHDQSVGIVSAPIEPPIAEPVQTTPLPESTTQYNIEMQETVQNEEETVLLSASFMFSPLSPPDYATDYSRLIDDGIIDGISFNAGVFTLINDKVYTENIRIPGYSTPDANSEPICSLRRNCEYTRVAVSDSGWSIIQLISSDSTVYVESSRLCLIKPMGDIEAPGPEERTDPPVNDISTTPLPEKNYNSDGLYLYAEVRGIPVYVGDDVPALFIRSYIKDIENLPDVLANPASIKAINITTDDLKEKFTSLAHIQTRVVGVTSLQNKTIWINGTLFAKNTILHESVHIWDMITKGRLSSSDEFKAIYAEEKGAVNVSPGNNVNAMEFLASAAELYYEDAYRLRTVAPKTYAFIRKNLD